MSENIGRKKSQRWTSASKTSYDGGDWESYSSNSEGEEPTTKLPALPKLNILPADSSTGDEAAEATSPLSSGSMRIPSQSMSIKSTGKSVNDDLDSLMHEISKEITPKFAKHDVNSDTEELSQSIDCAADDDDDDDEADLIVSKTGYFANYLKDTNNGSVAVDKQNEATVDGVQAVADALNPLEVPEMVESENVEFKYADQISQTDGTQESLLVKADAVLADYEDTDEEQNDLAVEDPKPSSFLESDESKNDPNECCDSSSTEMNTKEHSINEEHELELEGVVELHSSDGTIKSGNASEIMLSTPEYLSKKNEEQESQNSLANDDSHFSDENSLINGYNSRDSRNATDGETDHLVLRQTSKTDLSYQDAYSSDISFEDLREQPSDNGSNGQTSNKSDDSFKFRNRVRDSLLDTSDEESDSSNDGEFEVSRRGYFADMIEQENKKVDIDQASSKSVVRPSSESNSDLNSLSSGEASTIIQDSDSNSIVDSLTKSLSQVSFTKTINSGTNEEDEKVTTGDEEFDDDVDHDEKIPSSRESINLGKWKPDIENFRSGFVKEPIDDISTPEGYEVNEKGEIVGARNPENSSDDSDTMSTGSENSWNAFPQETGNDDDLHTIADTKTIYDNQTIYNVPAVLANNASAPALPKHGISSDSEFVSSNDTILKHIEGKPPHFDSKLGEVIYTSHMDATSIIKKSGIPSFDVNNLLASSESHSTKLQKLNDYKQQLTDYDSGLQSWIQYTLKSSDIPDRDFIFKDYKVNKHVQDAYAQADSLSKKNSVANTVNQNVSHLKKKMFSSSMREKSKGLFSSIGKKL